MTQNGYVLLFDLSGYTEFLTQSDLAQAHGILQSLLGTLLEHVEPPLQVAEIEGDAIFAFAPAGSFVDAHALIDAIERLYCVFAATREQMERNAACDCDGCKQFPRLDLKVIVHYGSFVLSRLLPDRPAKPVGADVVLAHRLLKNHVAETTGLTSYALVTQACADEVGPTWPAAPAQSHTESYSQLGDVQAYVLDLAPAWARERMKRLVNVGPTEAWIETSREIAAPPADAWNAINSPDFKGLWRYAEAAQLLKQPGSIRSTDRCYHGNAIAIEKVVDFEPLSRVTLDCEWPLGARLRVTLELRPSAAGTRVTARLSLPSAAVAAQNLFVRSFYRVRSSAIEARCRANLALLEERVALRGSEPDLPRV